MHAHSRAPNIGILPTLGEVRFSPVPRPLRDYLIPLGDGSEGAAEGCAAEVVFRRFDGDFTRVHGIVGGQALVKRHPFSIQTVYGIKYDFLVPRIHDDDNIQLDEQGNGNQKVYMLGGTWDEEGGHRDDVARGRFCPPEQFTGNIGKR